MLVGAPAVLPAQDTASRAGAELAPFGTGTSAVRACLAAVPRSEMRLGVVHVIGRRHVGEDSLPGPAQRSVDLTVETVAAYLRERLGAAPGTLPYADTTANDVRVTAAIFTGHIHVVGRRDGSVRWWPESDSASSADSLRRKGELLLGAALDSAVRAGEKFPWPDEYRAADSITFALQYFSPPVGRDGKLQPVRVGHSAAVIALFVPWQEPVRARDSTTLRFPQRARRMGAEGVLLMRFVVDTTGRAIPESIVDAWPADKPRPAGRAKVAYEDFHNVVREGIIEARFEPARIGGCAIPQLVSQAFAFGYPK